MLAAINLDGGLLNSSLEFVLLGLQHGLLLFKFLQQHLHITTAMLQATACGNKLLHGHRLEKSSIIHGMCHSNDNEL